MSVPQGWEHKSLLQQQEMRRVANVCLAFEHHFSAGFLLPLPPGLHPALFFLRSAGPEGASLSAWCPTGDLISFGKSSLHPTSSWHSFSSLIVPAGAQVGTGPQEPSSAGAVLCPCTGSRLAAQAGDTQGDSTANPLQMQPGSSTWLLLGLCRAGQLWILGMLLGSIWKVWLMIQLKMSLFAAGVGLDGL